jgi:hypothetical protein
MDIIRKLPDEDVVVEQKEDGTVSIRTSASEFSILGLPADEFPEIGQIDDVKKINLNKEILKEMIRKTSFSASVDESKGIIVGVLIDLHEHHTNMVAIDGFRMAIVKEAMKNEIIKDDIFDMELCLTKFKRHYAEIYTNKDLKFLERDGKLIFLTYLKPLINNTGFYHFESETCDYGKMDLEVDFLKQQFILELKIWYGYSKHEEDYEQLANYLKSKNMDSGYLLTFDFRKKGDDSFSENKWIEWEDKRIFDVVLRVGSEVYN